MGRLSGSGQGQDWQSLASIRVALMIFVPTTTTGNHTQKPCMWGARHEFEGSGNAYAGGRVNKQAHIYLKVARVPS